MYKMLVTDLDGTLLDDDKKIPEINIEAIERLHQDFGIIPVIATARPLEVARYIANQGGDAFGGYIIATNGAILMDIQKEECLIDQSFSPEQIRALIDVCKANGLEYECMTTKCEVADARYSYRRVIDPMYDNMGVPFNYQEDLEDYMMHLEDSIPLFAVNGTEEELDEALSKLTQIPGLQISGRCTRTTPGVDEQGQIETICYHDIMREGVTKATAIEKLADYLGIEKREIIAIGDGGNDIEMLQEAGLKIAMKNASESLKEIADVVTSKDNNHGGVGVILNTLHRVLEKKQPAVREIGQREPLEEEEPVL